jgi:hypothetical protein
MVYLIQDIKEGAIKMPGHTFEDWREVLRRHNFEVIVERNLSYQLYKRLDKSDEGPLLYLNPVGHDKAFNKKGREIIEQAIIEQCFTVQEIKEFLKKELSALGAECHTIVVKQESGPIEIRCPACGSKCPSLLMAEDPVLETRGWGADCPRCGKPFNFKVRKELVTPRSTALAGSAESKEEKQKIPVTSQSKGWWKFWK